MRFPVVNLGETVFTTQTGNAMVNDAQKPAPPAEPAPEPRTDIPFAPETASLTMQNPPDASKPYPRFITAEEAAKKKNITGLAVTGGILAAGIAAGLLIFR